LFSKGKEHKEEKFYGMTAPAIIVTIASSISMLPFYRVINNTIYFGIKYTRRDAICTLYIWEGIAFISLLIFFVFFKLFSKKGKNSE